MIRKALVAAGLTLAAGAASASVLLSEGFEKITTLTGAGWSLQNLSTPVGLVDFGQGDSIDFFAAQAGTANSYISANYNNAAPGGTLANWLITPTFSTATAVTVSFFARADLVDGYLDQIAFGFNTAGTTDTANFLLNAPIVVGGGWLEYTATLAAQGAGTLGRFGIVYTGNADSANYMGIDSLVVQTVPEPSSLLLGGLGIVALVALRRRMPRTLALAALAAGPALATAGEMTDHAAIAAEAPAGQANQIVVRDRDSGQLRAATPEEANALHRPQARGNGALRTQPKVHWTGARGARLTDDFMSHAVLVRLPDGRFVAQCVHSSDEAEAAVRAARAEQTDGTDAPRAAAKSNLPTE